MRSPPMLSDTESELLVEQSRAEGAEIVRHHLGNHVRNNPGRSSDYVTWIATLHPENADVSIDHRFLIPGNPWWRIYEQLKNDLPLATAVSIQEGNENLEISSERDREAMVPTAMPHWIYRCSPIEGLVSVILIMACFLAILICEVVALVFYLMAFIFYWIAKIFDPPNVLTGILYSLFLGIYYIFALGDSICLLASVLVTEILAYAGWFVAFIFGGLWTANHRHQFFRRTCHHIRWAFRPPFSEPPRHLSLFCLGRQRGCRVARTHY